MLNLSCENENKEAFSLRNNGFALETEAWRNSEMGYSYAQFFCGGGGGKQNLIINVKVEN